MHARLIVLLDKKNAKTPKEAQRIVNQELLDEGFCNPDGGAWSNAPSDWFQIGGRWSGVLQSFSLKTKEQIDKVWNKIKKAKTKKDKNKIWKQAFKNWKGLTPFERSQYSLSTWESNKDDAMIVTKTLWKNLISKLVWLKAGEITDDLFNGNGLTNIDWDEDEEPTAKNTIGKKWAVVVDFHY